MKPEELLPPDFPAGAIENGRAFADRLENDYSFECETGPLRTCVDWREFRRCFECLAEWVSRQQSAEPVDKSSNQQGYQVDKSPEKQEHPSEPSKTEYKEAAERCRDMGADTFADCFEKAAQPAEPVSDDQNASNRIGAWLSAALDDPNACDEFKADVRAWFDAGEPKYKKCPDCAHKDAQSSGPHDRDQRNVLMNIGPFVRALMSRLGGGEACCGLDGDQSHPYSTTQVVLRTIDEFESRLRSGTQPVKCETCRDSGIVGHSDICPDCKGTWKPAGPVKVPSADELTDFMWGYADEERTIPPRHFAIAARALLAKYAQQTAATLPIFVGLDLASGPDETVRWDGESPPTK